MSYNLGILFKEGLERNFFETRVNWDPMWRRFFHVEKTNKRVIDMVTWQGYGLPRFRLPGERVFMDQIQPSYGKRFVMRSYGLGDAFAKEDMDDDLYGILRRAIPSTAGAIAKTYDVLMEREAAFMFGPLGFTTGTVQGSPDGRCLFSTAHPMSKSNPNTTWSNTSSLYVDLSYDGFWAAYENLQTQLEPNGVAIYANKPRVLVYHPFNERVARAIAYSPWERGSSNLNVNFAKEMNLQLCPWPYYDYYSKRAWFIIGETHHLYWFIRSNIDVDSDFDVISKSQVVTTDVRFDYGWVDARGTYGARGA